MPKGHGHSKGWTEAEEAFLRKCIAEHLPSTYVAAQLNRSLSGVTSHATRLGIRFERRGALYKSTRKYG
jgi:hypothetical protein